MGVRYEWIDARYCSVEVAIRGTQIGDQTVTDEVALVLCGDEATVIEGSLTRVRARLQKALDLLDAAAA